MARINSEQFMLKIHNNVHRNGTKKHATNFKPRPLLHAQSYLVVLQTATDLILALEGRRGGQSQGTH